MDIIEFLQRTEHKSFKNFLGFKVRQKLQEYEEELRERQQRLRDIFEFENMQLREELLLLVQHKLENSARQRLDWINTKRMERQKAEEELLKVKNVQRDLENCEEWRHMQTHQLLVATKEAQFHQIAEKRSQRAKEQSIEQCWLAAMARLTQEKELQENYEAKLRKVVERCNQQKNLEIHDNAKKQQQLQDDSLRQKYHEENMRALAMDEKSKTDQKLREMYKKLQLDQWLKSQMASNRQRQHLDNHKSLQEDVIFKDREDYQIQTELDKSQRQKVRNNEWHKLYLEHCAREKQQRLKSDWEHERMYLNTGCVLQQRPKNPYGKQYR